jgi:hypothetical protein
MSALATKQPAARNNGQEESVFSFIDCDRALVAWATTTFYAMLSDLLT